MNPLYIITSLGIFVSVSIGIVIFILIKYHLRPGYWPLFLAVSLFLTAAEIMRSLFNKVTMYQLFIIVALIMMFFAALIKFWDTMRLIEQKF